MRRSLVALALAVTLPLPLPVLAGTVTVKGGETLSEIAERHGISLSKLMQINGIRNADQVEAGRTLTLPGGSGTRSAQAGRGAGTVTVKPGETLSEIAERQGISLSKLMQINGIRNADQVEAGQTLRLQGAAPATARSTASPAPAAPSYPRGASVHVVRSGESLSGIASGYGIGLSKLIALNGISDPDHVEAGTRLKLKGTPPAPTPRPAVTTAAVNAGTSRPTARPAAAAAPAARPEASAARPVAAATPATAATPAARPAAAPAARPVAPAVQQTAAATTAAPATVAMASRPDWRTYGPLQVNWAAWQPMGGSMVAPTLNGEGQTLYVAINCGARKFNSTTPAGAWQNWSDPNGDHEQQLVNDYCRTRT
ncbi:LysM domain-containing protein [Synechococcus sp. CBW1004]|uniref:LysM peptidoglycan-binding domain-containing protein n=1 Tax=Synechococcus sp. CBW1004 TaxID=1353136 RepID=UPI0018CEFB84|nr:LysM domain-containing protein [Synechococcus sp. CBW1004]QPN62791.1 LysM peptidoglycan-binding domain-containing protein [Synechococcus sp. CBW1004]